MAAVYSASTLVCFTLFCMGVSGNQPPVFTDDMNNQIFSEETPVGDIIYQLKGSDPEGSPVHYGIVGTDRLQVDRETGQVKLVQPLDREVNDTLRIFVTLEDEVDNSDNSITNNLVQVPISIIILDENDNAPVFKNAPYEVSVMEDTPVGSTVFSDIVVEDADLSGDTLEVMCEEHPQFPKTCAKFSIASWNSSQFSFYGSIVLQEALDYNERQFYQLLLVATDGVHNTTTSLEVKVGDIQNTSPVFLGSLTGVIEEDDPIGTLVMTVQARDGDRGQPRKIYYELVTNPLDYFLLDSTTGELRTAKPLDREALLNSTGVISLIIKAREMVDGMLGNDSLTSTTALASVTIKDVNDEPPQFNQREYSVSLPENIPDGTTLPNLDMIVTDPDVGKNAEFSLRLSDVSGSFAVEPTHASGSTAVSIRVINGNLDYENPNNRKFIVLVIAEETETEQKLSSTTTVTVEITDSNDNAPQFDREALTATVSETASPGTVVATFTASDRDSGSFGQDGIVYQLIGDGADKFEVEKKTGTIKVADCDQPGAPECLDFETRQLYFLSFKATDNEGAGQSSVVPLKITLLDSNDNPPMFTSDTYRAVIDEGAIKFEPPLQVQARDADKTSQIMYAIVGGNEHQLFAIDRHSGEITVADVKGLDMSEVNSDYVNLIIEASDGMFHSNCSVNITVLDVNNNAPVFSEDSYSAVVMEDTPVGTSVAKVAATDADMGINADLVYRIEKGAFEDFAIDNQTGELRVASKLDYDLRALYSIHVIAVDGGTPALTGTTTVQVTVHNSNDKIPFFDPPTQRAEVAEDAPVGTVIHQLLAKDLDVNTSEALNFAATDPITATDKNGKEVKSDVTFKEFFTVNRATGEVSVARPLLRDVAAVVSITVLVTDITAPSVQQGTGTLIVTIIDVNDYAPEFPPPWSRDNPAYVLELVEGQPAGAHLGTFTATDRDSNIAHYEINPPSPYFVINNATGMVTTTQKMDYEQTSQVNFTVIAYDSGAPQFSAQAHVTVNIINTNDMDPVFNQTKYVASIPENSPVGTFVAMVHAEDQDAGDYGTVRYSLAGAHSGGFTVDPLSGKVTVADPSLLDREARQELTVQVVATDGGPTESSRTATVPLKVKLTDVNDNPPVFTAHFYTASIEETVSLTPPGPIVQFRAQDLDLTSQLRYSILSGNVGDVFSLDSETGILYPQVSLMGQPHHYTLEVGVSDGEHTDQAKVNITILDVNQNQPTFIDPPSQNATVYIPETDVADTLIMTVKAEDGDPGENGRITYHFKVNDSNLQETDEFSINEETGELRSKIILDRETRKQYQLVLVARDHASPKWYEALRFLTIVLQDVDDNLPQFPRLNNSLPVVFQVMENLPPRSRIGKVTAVDNDEGDNARVYYYVVQGNYDRSFIVDRLDGTIYSNTTLDRELRDTYDIYIKATNDPDYYTAKDSSSTNNASSIAHVRIIVLDENDNAPVFQRPEYHAGVNVIADTGEFLCQLLASDADAGDNASLTYQVVASHLYRAGANVSSGSVVPSPFSISPSGRLFTVTLVAEYNQDRFRLEVVARENAHPFREAKATVHVWVYEQQQLIRVILSRPPEEVNRQREGIVMELSNATQSLVVVDDIRYHVDPLGHKQTDWCDMYLHVVNPKTQTIATIPDVLKVIDAKYDFLKDCYAGFAIENVIPAYVGVREDTFEPALAALIALLIVLFVGCVSVIVVCCCFRHWVIAEPMDMKSSDILIKKAILDDLNTTENPLWIEQKLKLYEEQELTMQVFCEPEVTQPGHERRDSADMSMMDNTYATIQQPSRRGSLNTMLSLGDYATLGGSVLPLDNVSSHSQQMFEAALGFQGSTFQVPENTEMFRGRSELRVNKDGQPEFVSELI
uniref:Cadherin domain-containing protein n=1 Tax=Graphocephala atropunctata TaxID=36148 RepID=A0A1B6L3B2_9HEMI